MLKRWEFLNTEGATKGVLEKKASLKISQNSQENRSATFIKKKLCHSCFPVNFAKIFKSTFFTEHLWKAAHINIQ